MRRDLDKSISNLRENLQDFANKFEKNSRQVLNRTQLKLEMTREKNHLSELYRELGEMTYKIEKGMYDKTPQDFTRQIDICLARIEALKNKYEHLKFFENR